MIEMSISACSVIFVVVFFYLSVFSFTNIHAHHCSEKFLSEAKQRNLINITFCKKYVESNGVEIAMYLREKSRRLDIMVGAMLEEQTGWLAWGLNPGPVARMVGTQALIGIKTRNGDLLKDKYNITSYTKIVGKEQPMMHPKGLRNYDSTETINLRTGKGRGNRVHTSSRIREVHGILNIIGWGTLLPIGVIIARNFRGFPLPWLPNWEKYHISCQTVGYIVGATGWAVGIWLGKASKYYSFPKHATFGTCIFAFATIQIVQMVFFNFKPGNHEEIRMYRRMFHHVVGYSLLVVSCINILKGIKIMHLDETYWLPAYYGIGGCLAFIFIVFEIVSWFKFLCDKFKLWMDPVSRLHTK